MDVQPTTHRKTPLRIRIFADFCTGQHAAAVYERVHELALSDFFGRDYYFTNDDDYTHAILLNTVMPKLRDGLPKTHVVGLAFEPVQYLKFTKDYPEYATKHVGKYYLGTNGPFPPALKSTFVERYGYMWHVTPPRSYQEIDEAQVRAAEEGQALFSMVVSEKRSAPGHQYRWLMALSILKDPSLQVDIWGRGCQVIRDKYPQYANDKRLRGPFREYEPYTGYRYHIAIENFGLPHYFSEKVVNPLLMGCTPIYLGCGAIEQYFPHLIITLTGDIKEDLGRLRSLMEFPDMYADIFMDDAKWDKVKDTISIENVIREWLVPPHTK